MFNQSNTFVDNSTYEYRINTCLSCPNAYYETLEDKLLGVVTCSVCGCQVASKAEYIHESCPIQKW